MKVTPSEEFLRSLIAQGEIPVRRVSWELIPKTPAKKQAEKAWKRERRDRGKVAQGIVVQHFGEELSHE